MSRMTRKEFMLIEHKILYKIHLESTEEMRKLLRILKIFLRSVKMQNKYPNEVSFAEDLVNDIEFRLPK